MADRIGVINHGEIILVQEKERLMRELGQKQLILTLDEPLLEIPQRLADFDLVTSADSSELVYCYDSQAKSTGITALLNELREAGIHFSDVRTSQSSLEDIFVDLVKRIR